jgi:Zn-dependent protease with chaperone function
MVGIDFDFARYVQVRKGQVEQRARDGAAYAFTGERKLRRTLAMARPVALAIEGTSRLWKGSARRELLDRARPASDQHHPRLHLAAREAARRLGVEPASVYVVDDFPEASATLGTDDDPVIVVRDRALRGLGDGELLALCGHELGQIQNNQVLLATALFYLRHRAVFFVRWSVQPAILALAAWSRRAEISCDRAALIASRDLDAAQAYLVRSQLGPDASDADVVAALAATGPRGIGRLAEVLRSHPLLDKRLAALRLFADSALYRKLSGRDPASGITTEELDLKVGEIVSVLQ